ncbi:endonuclease V [Haloplanus halophilus]|uniref:endonuclease V n=1 Tax=Haloplanus halophilus TaxID=2949993 RepID=UPI00203C2308|nr:endonuclease V [Haloplanus sp. GDY1]
MTPVRPEFVPDPSQSRAEMEALQRRVAEAARFDDDVAFDPSAVSLAPDASLDGDRPIVAGVDQAFLDDRAVSAVVCLRGGEVVERAHAVTPLEIPYVPGLLSFREGGPILAAFEALSSVPDLVVFDGSGRIHYRQAGLATHLGVVLDVPSVGVAKNLLCGRVEADTDGRPAGWRAPVVADEDVDAPAGTVLGYAYQSRQYDSNPVVNPLYVSPGHRVSAETAVRLVERLRDGYKLPEPTRLADAYADERKAALAEE